MALTLTPFSNTKSKADLVYEKTVQADEQGNVQVEFAIVNPTDTDALDGQVTIVVCNSCKFAAEIPEFHKIPGQADTERTMSFQRILARTVLPVFAVSVVPPPEGIAFNVGLNYRCHTCIVPRGLSNVKLTFIRSRKMTNPEKFKLLKPGK